MSKCYNQNTSLLNPKTTFDSPGSSSVRVFDNPTSEAQKIPLVSEKLLLEENLNAVFVSEKNASSGGSLPSSSIFHDDSLRDN